jgi:hypothetical protein
MVDVAFRVRFGEPFLPPEVTVPKPWLNWCLNTKLYESFERWSEPGHELNLAARLRGRWLDFRITDSPFDAIRSVELLGQTARFQIARHAWGTTKNVVYGPDYRER